MAWIDVETVVIGGATYVHQRGDQTPGYLGHRLVAEGTPGTPAPLNRLAQSGDVRAALPEVDLADQSGLKTVGIFTVGLASALTQGILDLVVSNVNTITADGAVQGASVGFAVNGAAEFPIVQAIVFGNAGGVNPTTAGYMDVGGGGVTFATLAAKIKAAVELGPAFAAGLISTATATTTNPNDTCRIIATNAGPAGSPRAWSLSDGLTITQTAGT